VIEKKAFLTCPEKECGQYMEYGFSFLYAVYCGMADGCWAFVISAPLVRQRGDNTSFTTERWYKYFATGSSLVFESLEPKGYSKTAVYRAKNLVLKDYIMHDISLRRRQGDNMGGIFSLIKPYYKAHLFFWMVCVPALFMPRILIVIIHKIAITIRAVISKVLFASKKNDIEQGV
jgi:hypothetical protein